MASVAEAAAQLRADLQLLDASTKEAAALLDLASWQLGELGRVAAPMTNKTLALARAKENISAAKLRSEEVLEHLDASRKMQGVIQAGPRANLEAFLAALGRLEAAIDFLAAHRSMQSAEDALRHTAALRDSALGAAGQEFSTLLQKHSAAPQALLARLRAGSFGSRVGSTAAAAAAAADAASSTALELLPEAVLPKLKDLAGAMLRGGSGGSGGSRACIRAYADARRGVMQALLEGFLSPFAGSKEELSWQQVAAKIPGWVTALSVFVQLAQEEARLCAAIFPAAEQAAVLSQVTASGAAAIVECAEAVLGVRRVPEKLFGVLDMHDAVAESLPLLKAVLLAAAGGASRLERASVQVQGQGQAGASGQLPVVGQLIQLRGRLAAEVRACFTELQDSLGREAKGVPADATVHPQCASTVSLLKRVLAYQSALPVLFGDAAAGDAAGAHGGGAGAGLAEEARLLDRMAPAVAHIFDALLSALDSRARLAYRSRAQAALHQLNNLAHVLHAVEASRELKAVGESWAAQHKRRVVEHQQQYVEAAWGSLLTLLRQDARQPLPPNLAADRAARQAVKDKWTAVNKVLAEAQAQQGWAVPDATLRHAIRDELAESLLPLYEGFWSKHQRAPYTDSHAKYERHPPADLQGLLSDLFERAEAGGGAQGQLLARSSSSVVGGGGALLGRKLSSTMRRLTSSSQGTP